MFYGKTVTALIVRNDEKKRVGIIQTRILRAVREWVGHCENCDTTENLTVHHTTPHWLFGIIIYCNECHIGWHWLTNKASSVKNTPRLNLRRFSSQWPHERTCYLSV